MRVLVELSVFGRARTDGQTKPSQLFVPGHKYPTKKRSKKKSPNNFFKETWKKKNKILCRIVISSKKVSLRLSTALPLDLLFPLSLSLSLSFWLALAFSSPHSFAYYSISLQFLLICYFILWANWIDFMWTSEPDTFIFNYRPLFFFL